MGSGSFSACCIPSGNFVPQKPPVFWYSFHMEPKRYPLTINSKGSILSFFTSIVRPSNSGPCSSSGISLRSSETI